MMYQKPTPARYHYQLFNGSAWSYNGTMIQPITIMVWDELMEPVSIYFSAPDSTAKITTEVGTAEQMTNNTKTIAAIWKAAAKAAGQDYRAHKYLTLREVHAALDQMKAMQIYHDTRQYPDYVTREHIPPTDHVRWMDDYRTMQRATGCTVSVCAATREEAQRLMVAELASEPTRTRLDYMALWLQAGRPVIVDTYARHPEIVDWPA